MSTSIPNFWISSIDWRISSWTQLGVVAIGVAFDARQLPFGGGHQQLEQELAIVFVQPIGEPLQPSELPLVHRRVAVGVVADQHLREVRVELLDVRAEIVAVLEVELVLAGLLDRHRQLEAVLAGARRDVRPELLIDQHPAGAGLGAALHGLEHPLKDQPLGRRDRLDLLGGRSLQRSRTSSSGRTRDGRTRGCTACRRIQEPSDPPFALDLVVRAQSTAPAPVRLRRRGTPIHRARVHDRDRGGADDPRWRVAGARQRDRVAAGARHRRRDQARADGIGAGDLDRAVPEHRRKRASSCARCAAR